MTITLSTMHLKPLLVCNCLIVSLKQGCHLGARPKPDVHNIYLRHKSPKVFGPFGWEYKKNGRNTSINNGLKMRYLTFQKNESTPKGRDFPTLASEFPSNM